VYCGTPMPDVAYRSPGYHNTLRFLPFPEPVLTDGNPLLSISSASSLEIRLPQYSRPRDSLTKIRGAAPIGSVDAVFPKTQDALRFSFLNFAPLRTAFSILCGSQLSTPEVRTSNIPSYLHNCETCGSSHPSDSVKAPSLNLEATFMRRPAALFFLLVFSATIGNAQRRGPINPAPATSAVAQNTAASSGITLPASTKITVALTEAVFSASAQPGDAIYAVTSFPVVADHRMAIPRGTCVQGFVDAISRPSGRSPHAEIRLHFVQMVFADGYSGALTLDGQRLTKGNYKATWTGAGDNVDVRLTRKKTPDIVVKAHVVKLPTKASKSIATPHANADGPQSLESVQFKGQTVALYFEQVSAGNSSPIANKPPGA
jgi:hypothetical protein